MILRIDLRTKMKEVMLRSTLTLILFCFLSSSYAQLPTFQGATITHPQSDELKEVFATYEMFKFNPADLYKLSVQKADAFDCSLAFGNTHKWDMSLVNYDMRSADYILTLGTEEGVQNPEKTKSFTYKGELEGQSGSTVILTSIEDWFFGFVEFEDGTRKYFEPMGFLVDGAPKDIMVLYRPEDVIESEERTCTVQHAEEQMEHFDDQIEVTKSAACYQVDISVAADWLFFDKYGSSSAVIAQVSGVLADVQTNYDDEFAHNIEYEHVETWISTCNTCDPWTSSTNAGTLLNSFTSWGPGGFNQSHDVAGLWTDRNFNGSTVGIAWLFGICNNNNYHCLQDFTTSAWSLRVLWSHELGHNWSSGHDGSNGFIMSPSVNNSNTWSGQSISTINSYINQKVSCFDACTTFNPPPVANFSSDINGDICEGDQVAFEDLSSNSPDSWFWDFPGGSPSSSSQQNPVVSYDVAGTYDVTLEVCNPGGCDVVTFANYVIVVGLPLADYSYTIDQRMVSFVNNSQYATNYLWDFDDGNFSTLPNPTHTYAEDGTYNVILEVSNQCGTDVITYTIVIETLPVAGFTSDVTEGCISFDVQFTDQSSSNAQSWYWFFEGGTPETSTAQNPSVTYDEAGLYSVELTVENGVGSNTMLQTDYINAMTEPFVGFTTTINADTVFFTNTTTGGTSFAWDFGDGNTSTDVNPYHVYAIFGDYDVTLTATNMCGTTSFNDFVTVTTAPIADFTANTNAGCPVLTIQFSDASTDNAEDFKWIFEGGSPDTSYTTNPIVTYANAGSYDVTLIVSNSAGNDTIYKEDFVQVGILPSAGFSQAIDYNTVDFTNTSTNSSTYLWDFGDGNTSQMISPSHSYDNGGNYTVMLIATNSCGNDTTTFQLSVIGKPDSDFSTSVNSGCAPLTVQYTDLSANNPTGWNWSFPGGNPASSTDQNPTVTYNMAGTFSATLEVSSPAGTDSYTLNTSVTIIPSPTADFSVDIYAGTATFNDNSNDATTYFWDFGDGNTSSDANPMHTYSEDGYYEVILLVNNQCGTSTFQQVIAVDVPPIVNLYDEWFLPTDTTNFGNIVVSKQSVQRNGALGHELHFSVYPNPNRGVFMFKYENTPTETVQVKLIDIVGKTVRVQKFGFDTGKINEQIDVSSLNSGTYLLEVEYQGNKSFKKIVIN